MHSRFVSRLCRVLVSLCALHVGVAFATPGDRDASFGNGGGVVYAVPGVLKAWALRTIQTSDGKIVAVGYAQPGPTTTQDMLIVRFNVDGSLDTTFGAAAGTPGRVQIDFAGFADLAYGAVEQVDGKLVVVGSTVPTSNPLTQMAAVRLLADGQLDPSFGAGGKLSIGPISGNAIATDAFVLEGGAIVVGGGTQTDVTLVRLLANGAIDVAGDFGVSGFARVAAANSDLPNRVIRQSDGRFTVVGRIASPGPIVPGPAQLTLLATRFTANGFIDTTFGAGGRMTIACDGSCNWTGVTQASDGKLIVTGFTSLPGVGNPLIQQEQSGVWRFNSDGSPDMTFGIGGTVLGVFVRNAPTFIPSGDQAVESYVDPVTGGITVLGAMNSRVYNATGTGVGGTFLGTALARLSSNGLVDTGFGFAGVSMLTFNTVPLPVTYNSTSPRTLMRLQDGRMVALGLAGEYVNGVAQAQAIALTATTEQGEYAGVVSSTYPGPMSESIGQAVVRVFRASGSKGATSVAYSTVSGTAQAGLDFQATSGVLDWADGDYSIKLVSIPIIADAEVESLDETFSFELSNAAGGAAVAGPLMRMTIARDDVAPTNGITLSQVPVSVAENAGSVTLQVTRTGTTAISANYYTIAGSAQKDIDFATTGGILVWSTGDTSAKTITVPINNDSEFESSESFNVVLVTQGGAPVYGGQTATVTITNDDAPPQVGFVVTNKTVNESDGLVTFDVTRVGSTSQSVSVNYATANGTAMAGSDYQNAAGTLTWGPNDANTKTIAVTLLGDALHEGATDETFAINLSDATGGAILGANTATVTVVDDDAAPQLSFDVAAVTVNERDAVVVLTVTRQGASGLVHTVDFATANGTAKAGRDYVATSGTLYWLATDPDTKTITVPIIRKPRRERDETFTVTLSNPTSGATVGLAIETVTIIETRRR